MGIWQLSIWLQCSNQFYRYLNNHVWYMHNMKFMLYINIPSMIYMQVAWKVPFQEPEYDWVGLVRVNLSDTKKCVKCHYLKEFQMCFSIKTQKTSEVSWWFCVYTAYKLHITVHVIRNRVQKVKAAVLCGYMQSKLLTSSVC